jgi:hypothetical protein
MLHWQLKLQLKNFDMCCIYYSYKYAIKLSILIVYVFKMLYTVFSYR